MSRGNGRSGRGANGIKLGKTKYIIRRSKPNSYDERGKFVKGGYDEIEVMANAQGALVWNRILMRDSGEDMKQTMSLRVNEEIFCTRTGVSGETLSADVLVYQGALWEARDIIKYRNLHATAHDEVLFVRLDESPADRNEDDGGGCCNGIY